MNTILKMTTAAAAIAALGACDMLGLNGNDSAGGNAASNVAAGNASANASADAGGKDPAETAGNAAASSSAPFTGEVTAAFLVGRWTDTGDCTKTIEFRDDGSFATEGGNGMWTLNGDRLTFQGSSTVSAQVAAPNADTIMLTHPDGTVGRSTRCR
ncbi:MAG TPA: hypothetical protein VD887_04915 [Allosphingosinicella sp.]|nr:hypothetical protein [Allosphingosinicella sp.]